MKIKKILTVLLAVVAALPVLAKTTYVVWQHNPATGSEEWIKSNYYIWENTYQQTNVGDALELTASNKGWVGGGYESVAPFDNRVLTEGYELVFDIKTADTKELSVQLTCANPEAAQSVKLNFPRDGEWHTIRFDLKKHFPKVLKAWATPASTGYIFSLVGGATDNTAIYLRNIRYQKSY